MADTETLALLKKCIEAKDFAEWNAWLEAKRQNDDAFRPGLEEADLFEAHLQGADLREADLNSADLAGADLRRANLAGARLVGADLRGADLSGANLYWADLEGADFRGANLKGANLQDAYIGGTFLPSVDLRQVRGLESVQHEGPSEISISTLYKSHGNIPEAFLRACGVPEDMITFIRENIRLA